MRAYNCLKRAGITKVGEVLERLQKGKDEILAIRNFGQKSLDELMERLGEKGYLEAIQPAADIMTPSEDGGIRIRDRRAKGNRVMRHQVAGRQLGRDKSARKALFRSLITELFRHERIETTEAKAKAIRGGRGKVDHARQARRRSCARALPRRPSWIPK